MQKDVLLLTGAGQIGLAITRRVGAGKKILIGDKVLAHAQRAADLLNQAGFDAEATEMDLSSRASILALLEKAQGYGPITTLVNAAGVSPSQAPIEAILKVDLYGYFRAVDRPAVSLILTICSLGTRVALAYLLSAHPAIGVTGIWAAIPIGWFFADTVGGVLWWKDSKTVKSPDCSH